MNYYLDNPEEHPDFDPRPRLPQPPQGPRPISEGLLFLLLACSHLTSMVIGAFIMWVMLTW